MPTSVLNFKRIADPFEPERYEGWCSTYRAGAELGSYLPGDTAGRFAMIVNGQVVDPATYVPEPGDVVSLVEIPRGGASVWVPIVISLVLAGGSYLVTRLTMPDTPDSDFSSPDGPVSSFGGIQTVSAAGIPLPICYGEVRTGGNVVDSFESVAFDEDFLDEEVDVPIFEKVSGLPIPTGRTEKVIVKNRLARSQSRVNTRIVLCAGPIEDIHSIQIDDRDIDEFPGLIVTRRFGTQHQPSIVDFNKVVTTRTLILPVPKASPQIVTTSTVVEQIEIVLRFPQGIYKVKDDGFKFNRQVEILVEYRLEGASTWTTAGGGPFLVDDFAVNPLEYRIRFGPLDPAIYEVRVTRITDDEVTAPEQNNFSAFEIFFINEIDFRDRNHPGVAQMAFAQLPGEQVSPVNPTNYTAVLKGFNNIRQYTDEQNYTESWTDNPAWCCGHFLTDKLNGLGVYFDWEDIDIPSFIEWAEHADELVEDGRSALEKRATFNRIFDQRTNAFEILETFAIGSGVSLIYKGAKFRAVVDKPRPRVQEFHEGNVLGNEINKAYFPKAELPTRIHLQFLNSENNWERDSVMEEDPNISPGRFQPERTIQMLHVTRPGQAAREAMRMVRTNTLITKGVDLRVGLQAVSMTIGDRFGLASYGIGIGLGSGQITRVDNNIVLHLDDDIIFEAGKTYGISVQHIYDGKIDTVPLLHPGAGVETNIVQVVGNVWTRKIQAGDMYAVGELAKEIEDFRVDEISIGGLGERFQVEIRAGLYDEAVYDLTPVSNPFVEVNEITNRNTVPGRVTNLQVIYSPAEPESRVGRRSQRTLEVDWNPPSDGFALDFYEVLMRETDPSRQVATWRLVGTTRGRRFEISENIDVDTRYQVTVRAVSPGGHRLSIDRTPKADIDTY